MDFSWLMELLWLGDPPEHHAQHDDDPAPPAVTDHPDAADPGDPAAPVHPGDGYATLAGAPGASTDAPAAPVVPGTPVVPDYGANQDFMNSLDAQMDHASEIYREAMEAPDTPAPAAPVSPAAPVTAGDDPYHAINSLLQGDIAAREISNSIHDQELRVQTVNELSRLTQDVDDASAETA